MKYLPLTILILVTFSSCSFYQYSQLSSNIKGTTKEPFTVENDTLLLRYFFNHGVEEIEIYNKHGKALYVDWSRSSLILDGNSYPYWTDRSIITTTSTSYNSQLVALRTNTHGVITNGSSRVSFIPPDAGLKKTPFDLRSKLNIDKKLKVGERKQYTEDSTPLKFRSYLMLSFDQNFNDPIILDHTFWVSETLRSELPIQVKPAPNVYFNR